MRLVLAMALLLIPPGWLCPARADRPAKKDAKAPPALYNKAVVTFCQRHLNKKVGSGECAHLASEALRVAGADFIPEKFGDRPKAGDFVWGTLLKQWRWDGSASVDSNPKASCQAGDIVQYRDATFSDGKTVPHHTSIIAAVDDRGRPTAIYEQNMAGKRHVLKEAVDFGSLTGGWVRIYRPSKPRRDARMPVEFTLLNRTDKPVSYKFGGREEALSEYDSERGFRTWRYGGVAVLVVGRSSVRPTHRKAYEIYKTDTGKIALREMK